LFFVIGKPYFEERHYPHYIRNKRQFNIDPMAKHVEILIAYDDSIKEFHSDIDIESYILTLFNYVSLKKKEILYEIFVFDRFHIYILMQVLEIILKYGQLN
jgi:hypothetical protein